MVECDASLPAKLVDAALRHGHEEGMETAVGDLEILLQACWSVMSREDWVDVMQHPDVQELLEIPEYEEFAKFKIGGDDD